MNEHVNFTSLPPEQEATFVVYERHQTENLKSGRTAAIIASAVFTVLALGVYFGVEPKESTQAKDMDLNQLKKKSKVEAPSPAPAPAATPEAPSK